MRRVLVVSPHPDDESIGCGGTVRKHVLAGDTVEVLFLTSGEAGGHGIAEPGGVREQEAAAAAAILGVEAYEFWRERDGALRARTGLVERLRAKLEDASPDVVYVPHDREFHPDHRGAARALRRSLAGANGRAPDVLMYEVWTPLAGIDAVVDITPVIETKLAAIRAYRSQCDVMRFDDAFRGLGRYRGEMFNWHGGAYAEVFTRAAP